MTDLSAIQSSAPQVLRNTATLHATNDASCLWNTSVLHWKKITRERVNARANYQRCRPFGEDLSHSLYHMDRASRSVLYLPLQWNAAVLLTRHFVVVEPQSRQPLQPAHLPRDGT